MPFPELVLRDAPPPAAGLPSRADVAMFVGLVARRPGPLPEAVAQAIAEAGWSSDGPFPRSPAAVAALLDMPVAVSSWDAFDALFAWETRTLAAGSARTLACPLALAVRSFFTEGGIKAWIVRTGDPLPLIGGGTPEEARQAKRALLSWGATPPPDAGARVPLIPGLIGGQPAEATDPGTWHGAAHVWGVDDVAMLSLPDLIELCAPTPAALAPLPAAPAVPEAFKLCAPPAPGVEPDRQIARPQVTAPRMDRLGYRRWGEAIARLLAMLAAPRGAAHRRDVMLMASLPLPRGDLDQAGIERNPLTLLDDTGIVAPGGRLLDGSAIGSARLQLAWPWVGTPQAVAQPEGLEAPEGVLMGAVARTALAGGAFRSAASARLASVTTTVPELRAAAMRLGLPDGRADWMGDRLCLIGRKPGGIALLSDATMSARREWRAGGVSRLMGIILRAGRWLGQDRLFEPAGPAMWANISLDLETFMRRLLAAGALAGPRATDAFTVRCGASTMSQADLDAGRTVVTIGFTAAQPIQRIEVTLALAGAGFSELGEAA